MATTAVPAEVLARLFDENSSVQYELVKGELEPLPVSNVYHAVLIWWVAYLLSRQAGKGFYVSADVHSKIDDENWRRPDIIVVRIEDIEGWKYVRPGHLPLLCVEIVSAPDQTAGEMFHKCSVYHQQGVSYCWILEPISQTAWTYHQNQVPIWIPNEGGVLEAGEIRIPLEEIWRELNAKRANLTPPPL